MLSRHLAFTAAASTLGSLSVRPHWTGAMKSPPWFRDDSAASPYQRGGYSPCYSARLPEGGAENAKMRKKAVRYPKPCASLFLIGVTAITSTFDVHSATRLSSFAARFFATNEY